MGVIVDFFVPGLPQPGGSKKAFVRPGMKFAQIVDANPKAKDWKAIVGWNARSKYKGLPLRDPLRVTMDFVRPWRKGDLRRDGTPKNPSLHHVTMPDVLKLARSTEDAMTGIIWADDSQTVVLHIKKGYGDIPGVRIVVESLNQWGEI